MKLMYEPEDGSRYVDGDGEIWEVRKGGADVFIAASEEEARAYDAARECADSPTGRHEPHPERWGDTICVWCLEESEPRLEKE